MKPLQELTPFWNWLPTFRAVAETEHLPTAAAMMHLTPSALSRTIRLLEEELGQPLFERRGRKLVLLPAGEHLLNAVRIAMRTIHEGMRAVQHLQHRGPLRVHAPAPLGAAIVLPAFARLKAEQPMLEPILDSQPAGNINSALLQGDIDLALVDDLVPDDNLSAHLLIRMRHRVYCAPGHPLAAASDAERPDALARAVFVAPTPGPSGKTPDAWPLSLPRTIGLRVSRMFVAIEAVLTGDYVAILPDIVATRLDLVPIALPEEVSSDLFILHRPSVDASQPTRVELLTRHIEAVVEGLDTVGGDGGRLRRPGPRGGAQTPAPGQDIEATSLYCGSM